MRIVMPLRGLMDDRPVGLRVYKIDREYVHLAVQQNYLLENNMIWCKIIG